MDGAEVTISKYTALESRSLLQIYDFGLHFRKEASSTVAIFEINARKSLNSRLD